MIVNLLIPLPSHLVIRPLPFTTPLPLHGPLSPSRTRPRLQVGARIMNPLMPLGPPGTPWDPLMPFFTFSALVVLFSAFMLFAFMLLFSALVFW